VLAGEDVRTGSAKAEIAGELLDGEVFREILKSGSAID
jgi:hypothetical protein